MSDQRNLILAFAISMGILLIWNMYVSPPPPPAEPAVSSEVPNAPANANTPTPSPQPGKGADAVVAREQAIENTPRLPINSPSLKGSIALKGGRIDDLIFTKYFTTVEQETPEILLSPAKTVGGYYANLGWVAASGQAVAVPGADTIWTPDGDELTPNRPVTLTWDNGAGLTFERRIEVDDDYMFTITQRVRATGSVAATLIPYGLVARLDTPKTAGIFVLHEGPLGVFDSTLKTLSYSDMREDGPVTRESTGGWIGITDKYWMTALIPDQSAQVMGRFVHTNTGRDRYQTDFIYKSAIAVSPGQDAVVTTRLFAGAKEVDLINNYRKAFDIDRFDLTIDWGWFVFLTKPFFWALHQIHGFVGNFGIAILGLTVLIKLVFFPLANTSYKSLAKMKAMQPRMKEIRERYGDDKARQQQEMMQLYKKEKINPLAGCLPILIQIPVFFALYKVLIVTIEMRHEPFFGWIRDLSAPDPLTPINLFGLIPFDPPQFIAIGIWPILMGISMWLQQKLNPNQMDPVQQKIFAFMPIIFTIILAPFAAGLVIYWTWNNLLSIAQQWWIMRKYAAEHPQKA